jgi:hypothetical protein
MALDPVRSPVGGTLREALQVALDYQRYAAGEHETWPVGVAWGEGERAAYLQWSHDPASDDVPDGFLGLLEVGVEAAALPRLAPALGAAGFDGDPEPFGSTRVLAWQADDDARRIADADALLDLLERAAGAAGAPSRADFEVYPDA